MKVPESFKVALASLGLGGAPGLLYLTLALLLISGECSAWRQDHQRPKPPVASVLPPTPAELATPHETVPCVAVQVLKPTEKRSKEIARETGRPAAAPEPGRADVPVHLGEIARPGASSQAEPDYPLLLADGRPYPPSPEGGRIWSWLEMDGSNTLVAKPNPTKPLPADRFFDFRPTYLIGGAYSPIGGETRGKVYAGVEFLRAGRFHVRVEGGADFVAGQSGTYGMVGVEWRSRQ